ncbi:MAG: cupin domain-containing protein [Thiohalomonadaceae bacterium]
MKSMHTQYTEITAYQTKDGSEIRELIHPAQHGNQNQSLAESIVQPGQATALHRHLQAEELYHITAGHGLMQLGNDEFPIATGDTICILPGTPHLVRNTGNKPLHFLCCCAPAYSHDDTELL